LVRVRPSIVRKLNPMASIVNILSGSYTQQHGPIGYFKMVD